MSRIASIATVLVLTWSAVSGFAQCNSNRIPARKEMHDSSAVILGTVVSSEAVPETWDFLDGTSYTVRVDAVIHGRTDRSEYKIFSENTPAAFGMMVGKHYVLYMQPQYDRYQVSSCGNSHQTEELEASAAKQLTKGY